VIDRAVLLCAGAATRLRPLTDDRPKCLLDVGGETILIRAVRVLLSAGVRKLVIAPDFARTQNAVSLYRCASVVAGQSFFKLDGDVLFGSTVLERLAADAAPLSVAVERRANLGEEEMKVVTEGNYIRAFGKKKHRHRETQ
jgi:choline kinase